MVGENILNEKDLRRHIAFMLNNQFDVNIQTDNIRLSMDEMKYEEVPYIYEYNIGIELGRRLPVKPLVVIMDPNSIAILYSKKNTKDGYEFNEVCTILSFVDSTGFSMEVSEQK